MSLWSQYRMIDIMSQIDLSLVEEDVPEGDLDNLNLFPEKKKWSTKKKAVVSGIAAGSIALTGVVVLLCRKYDLLKKAA